MRKTQPIIKRPNFFQEYMSNCYNGDMINNNNIIRYEANTAHIDRFRYLFKYTDINIYMYKNVWSIQNKLTAKIKIIRSVNLIVSAVTVPELVFMFLLYTINFALEENL